MSSHGRLLLVGSALSVSAIACDPCVQLRVGPSLTGRWAIPLALSRSGLHRGGGRDRKSPHCVSIAAAGSLGVSIDFRSFSIWWLGMFCLVYSEARDAANFSAASSPYKATWQPGFWRGAAEGRLGAAVAALSVDGAPGSPMHQQLLSPVARALALLQHPPRHTCSHTLALRRYSQKAYRTLTQIAARVACAGGI